MCLIARADCRSLFCVGCERETTPAQDKAITAFVKKRRGEEKVTVKKIQREVQGLKQKSTSRVWVCITLPQPLSLIAPLSSNKRFGPMGKFV